MGSLEGEPHDGIDATKGNYMNDNIHRLLEILRHWKNKFPNIEMVTASLSDTELRIRVEWKAVNDMEIYYSRTLPLKDLDSLYPFNALENSIFDEIESKYNRWEVGEE